MKLSAIVPTVISLARAANQARMAEGSEDDSPILTSGGDTRAMKLQTAAERSLRDFLAAQPPSVVYMLTAIMYLGRGDFGTKELRHQYKDISESFGDPRWAARQMLGKMTLPEYLEEGLKKLAQVGVEVDKLLPT